MKDLESLLSSVKDRTIRQHVREAITCYQAGAFRSAIIITWTAVTLDLVNKIKFLEEIDPPKVDPFSKRFDNAVLRNDVKALRNLEYGLLDKAKEMQFLSERECLELRRLREDRNSCAHPAFIDPDRIFSPTPELVRSHLAAAVNGLLSAPPIPGARRETEFNDAIGGNRWPDQHLKWAYLKTRFFRDVSEATQNRLIELLIERSIELPSAETVLVSPEQVTKRAREAVAVIRRNVPGLLSGGIPSVLEKKVRSGACDDATLLRVVGSLGAFQETWDSLDNEIVERIIAAIDATSVAQLFEFGVFSMDPAPLPQVRTSISKRLMDAPEAREEFEELILNTESDRYRLVAPSMNSLSQSNGFRIAEYRLGLVGKLASEMTPWDLEHLKDIICENQQILFAAGTEVILKDLLEKLDETGVGRENIVRFVEDIVSAASKQKDPAGGPSPTFQVLQDEFVASVSGTGE